MSTKTTTLTLGEIVQLDGEINGIKDPASGRIVQRGIIAEHLPLSLKYHLSKLGKAAQEESKEFGELYNETIKRLGEEDGKGGFKIEPKLEQKVSVGEEEDTFEMVENPKFVEFNEEIEELMKTEKEISHYPFSIEEFASVHTANVYTVFFKILGLE